MFFSTLSLKLGCKFSGHNIIVGFHKCGTVYPSQSKLSCYPSKDLKKAVTSMTLYIRSGLSKNIQQLIIIGIETGSEVKQNGTEVTSTLGSTLNCNRVWLCCIHTHLVPGIQISSLQGCFKDQSGYATSNELATCLTLRQRILMLMYSRNLLQ